MHFGTFPQLTGTYEEFQKQLEQRGVDVSKLVNTPEYLEKPWTIDPSSLA